MHVSTRIVSEEPRSLYVGDIIEGALAAEQVAAGNAEYLPEPEVEAPADAQPEPDQSDKAAEPEMPSEEPAPSEEQ